MGADVVVEQRGIGGLAGVGIRGEAPAEGAIGEEEARDGDGGGRGLEEEVGDLELILDAAAQEGGLLGLEAAADIGELGQEAGEGAEGQASPT